MRLFQMLCAKPLTRGLCTTLLLSLVLSTQAAQTPTSPSATISGKLSAKDGTPLSKVRVAALAVPEGAGAQGDALLSLAETDAQGVYRLENVPPGRYYIVAGFVISPTYYPGVLRRSDGTIIQVAAGETRGSIDFSAASLSSLGASLSGRVIQNSAQPATSVVLSGPGLPGGIQMLIRPDGTFEFPKLAPGVYNLRTTPLAGASATVTIADKDVTGLELVAPTETQVSGRILTEDGSPVPNSAEMGVHVRSINQTGKSSIQPGGFFKVRLREGDNDIGIEGLPLGYSIKSVSLGNRDFGLGPVRVDAATSGEMRITLSVTPLEKVEGVRVRGSAINVAPEILVGNSPLVRLWIPGGRVFNTPLRKDGSFEFAKIPPGGYEIKILSPDNMLATPNLIVGSTDIDSVKIDLENNPFPEYPGSSVARVFDGGKVLTLHGTITQEITQLKRAPARYFRMDVKDQAGDSTIWAVLLFDPTANSGHPDWAQVKRGAIVTVVIQGDREGKPRGNLVPQTGPDTVFGIRVEN